MTTNRESFDAAKAVIPGGVDSPVRSFKEVGGTPLFIDRAKGSRFWDVEGQSYLDFCMSWGTLILGHSDPEVVKAIQAAAERGTSYGAPSPLETELAETIHRLVPSMDLIRFVSSGTEATMSAIRLARGFTQRSKIVKFDGCYHGHVDHLLVSAGSGVVHLPQSSSDGVPASFTGETISIPYNSPEALKQVFKDHPTDIAAIIIEPVAANMGVVLPETDFLKLARTLTQQHDSLLIFDEVICGLRIGLGGAQGYFDIKPDITCMGKIIGGGLPVGAYGGRKDIFEKLAPLGPVYQAGTLSGNPLAMSAGLATLKQLSQPDFYDSLHRKSQSFLDEVEKLAKRYHLTLNRIGSMFTLFMTDQPVRDYQSAKTCHINQFQNIYHHLLDNHIYTSPAQFEANFISSAHSGHDLDQALTAFANALAAN